MSSPDDSPAETPSGSREQGSRSALQPHAAQHVPRVYFIQHEPRVRAAQLGIDVRALGVEVCIIEAWRAPTNFFDSFEPDGPVVVLGGTMDAYADQRAPWLPSVRRFLQQATIADHKLLGICLGHQLLAVANGGCVSVADEAGEEKSITQIEWVAPDPFVTAIGSPAVVFEDHADAVTVMPPGAIALAASRRYLQAMRIGSAVSVQFHPEVNTDLITEWYCDDEPQNLPQYLSEYRTHASALRELSRRIAHWLTDPSAA